MKTLHNSTVEFVYARLVMHHVLQPINIIYETKHIAKLGEQICILDIDDDYMTLYPTLLGMTTMIKETVQLQEGNSED